MNYDRKIETIHILANKFAVEKDLKILAELTLLAKSLLDSENFPLKEFKKWRKPTFEKVV